MHGEKPRARVTAEPSRGSDEMNCLEMLFTDRQSTIEL
jgi:hypothetical protein